MFFFKTNNMPKALWPSIDLFMCLDEDFFIE